MASASICVNVRSTKADVNFIVLSFDELAAEEPPRLCRLDCAASTVPPAHSRRRGVFHRGVVADHRRERQVMPLNARSSDRNTGQRTAASFLFALPFRQCW